MNQTKRIIKFRILSKNDEDVYEWEYFELPEALGMNNEIYLRSENYKLESLTQYTGLNDKNGKEIYEGDVVYLAGYGDYVVKFPFIKLYEAVAEKDIGEIKGNIYESPELIKTND